MKTIYERPDACVRGESADELMTLIAEPPRVELTGQREAARPNEGAL